MNFYSRYIKRILDIVLSLVAIIVLLPIYILVGIFVAITMGFPILFSQDRIGKDEETFKLYKFRSMTNARDKDGNLLEESKRLTRAGRFLRSTSLDELPELFSILIGDMSFVGPRPLPVYYGPYFYLKERKRHSVKGGLIPCDDLSGKVMISWEEQFKYDCYYAGHVSFSLDVKIVLMTFKILLDRLKENYGVRSIERPHLNQYREREIRNK